MGLLLEHLTVLMAVMWICSGFLTSSYHPRLIDTDVLIIELSLYIKAQFSTIGTVF